MTQEPDYTVYTDRTRSCSDYVWYTGENLNANSALHVRYLHPQLPVHTFPASCAHCMPCVNEPITVLRAVQVRSCLLDGFASFQ